jgi:hypothetical protein
MLETHDNRTEKAVGRAGRGTVGDGRRWPAAAMVVLSVGVREEET